MTTDASKPSLKLQTSNEMPPPPTSDAMAAATPSTENPRPILKLNTHSRQASFSGETPTPSASSERKIKIKLNASQPSTPAASTPSIMKTKAGRSSKPTAKLIESKKRSYESDEDQPMASSRPGSASRPMLKKIKMKPPISSKRGFVPVTPVSGIKFRPKGEPIEHKPGDAYDSEASDREPDPVRESVMVLRTVPGPSTEYLRRELEAGNIGKHKSEGGADLSIQFVDARERRALVTVNGVHYAAVLVDLPTITEAMKSWDRKSIMKNSDISQMLLCYAEVRNEMEAKTIALPAMAQKGELKWPHGLTPPMHDAANRRFRKVMSEKQLISTSAQVKKLLADDAEAVETQWDYIQEEGDASDYGEADAEGEMDEEDYFGPQATIEEDPDSDIDEAGLEAMMEADVEDDDMLDTQTPGTQLEAPTPRTAEANTPAAPQMEGSDGEADGGDDGEELFSDEDDDDDLDDDELSKQAENREILEEMREFQTRLAREQAGLAGLSNAILRKRKLETIQNFKTEIALRKAKLGITDDD